MINNLLKNKPSHYINGTFVAGTGMALDSINPANGSSVWQGRLAAHEEVSAAFAAARQALQHWANFPFAERVKRVQNFSQHVAAKRKQLAQLISLETGKPLWESDTEVNAVIGKISLSIKAYEERTAEKKVSNADATGYVRYKPHGVVAVLGPFNFPAHLSNGHIVPALLAGNTIVYKPSELTPGVAQLIAECWHDSDLPAGVFNCIQGEAQAAKTLLSQDIQGVFFTGSYQTGLKIHQQFSERPEVILALEMGGNNPLILDEVNNIKAALYYTLLSTLITAGQRCTCARRLLIPDSQKGDEFLSKFIKLCQQVKIGEFNEQPEPFMGPVIRYEHALSHLAAQKHLQEAGGIPLLPMTLLRENTGFLSPGIMDMSKVNNPPDTEIFAPFVQVYRYRDFDEALTLANQTRYGLAAGLLSDNEHHYQHFFATIRAGVLSLNRPTTGAASNLPFGGIGHSGNHRPSAYFAADYCAYPIASLEQSELQPPAQWLPGIPGDEIR
ncbi:succinylglutamate-semialdehyde dehydrogenase [Legionella septentrionalis]|uniref:succinylglutamate-semialdehyde dehydrogenase n=1 Tax=Legionella septentrionalis TaxID=2498109 RepID=UPI000F8C6B63|nr:succinylglutamate-semialdehyde dehydrogenase [Legionella septentrionalis]RUR09821.1 succinylglutamate-semialdehyde dehydrogenase [Legionella septentrionalis]RUR13634.1 succinylglutamate-semialdehyde dehydrogenase [Legionella septentrionalis]